ncbi:hypothetical protein GCM10027423_61200 [Spirosoma arcticum]
MGQRCAALLTTIGDALYAVGGKWTLRVIIAIAHGNKRFNELQRAVTGISARVLSNELRELELNGFVKRTVHADVTPVLVEYVLTDYSNTLEGVVQSLSEWGAMHRNKVRQPVT